MEYGPSQTRAFLDRRFPDATCRPLLLLQATVLRCSLHSAPGSLPFTFYPAMPGNSTAAPAEKWEHQRPAMAALMGPAAADSCFQGAAT